MKTDSASVQKEEIYFLWIKRINNILIIIMLLFAIWYYFPVDNRMLRAGDICGYTAIKDNQTCKCSTPKAGRTFYPNGTMLVEEYYNNIKINLGDFNGSG